MGIKNKKILDKGDKKRYNITNIKGVDMAFRNGVDRNMGILLPQYLDDYIPKNHIVRVYDKVIDMYSDKELGLEYNESQVGNSRYNPRIMLKILIYSYSQGIRSSRKIEKALYENLSFKWLARDLKPDHKTISEYRRNNQAIIKRTLKKVILMCKEMDLINGNYLFIDGTKIKGNASLDKAWTKKRIRLVIKRLDSHINKLIEIHKKNDELEEDSSSYVIVDNIEEKINKLKIKKKQLEKIDKEIEKREGEKSYNTTDKDTILLNTRQGTIIGYNGQIAVDEKNGIIISNDIVRKNNDFGLFKKEFNKAVRNTGIEYKGGVADAGYSKAGDLKELIEKDKDIIVPSQRQRKEEKDIEETKNNFSKDKFRYDEEKDIFICPMGYTLKYQKADRREKETLKRYVIEDKNICLKCPYYGKCTKSKTGRTLSKGEDEHIRKKLENRYYSKEGKEIYKKRKYKVETVFGHMKKNLGFREFLLRGIDGALTEFNIFCINYNIMKMVNILGTEKILAK